MRFQAALLLSALLSALRAARCRVEAEYTVQDCLRRHAPAAWREPLNFSSACVCSRCGSTKNDFYTGEDGCGPASASCSSTKFTEDVGCWSPSPEGCPRCSLLPDIQASGKKSFLDYVLWLADKAQLEEDANDVTKVTDQGPWAVPASAVRSLLVGRGHSGGISPKIAVNRQRSPSKWSFVGAFHGPSGRILEEYSLSELVALCNPALPERGMEPLLYGLKYDRDTFAKRCPVGGSGPKGCTDLTGVVSLDVSDSSIIGSCDADSSHAELLRLRLKQLILNQRYYVPHRGKWFKLEGDKQCKFGQRTNDSKAEEEAESISAPRHSISEETSEGDEGHGWQELLHGTVTAALGAKYTRVSSESTEDESDQGVIGVCSPRECNDDSLLCETGLTCLNEEKSPLPNHGMGQMCTPPSELLSGTDLPKLRRRCYNAEEENADASSRVYLPNTGTPSRTHYAVHTAKDSEAYRLIPGKQGNLWENVVVENGFYTAEDAFDRPAPPTTRSSGVRANDGRIHQSVFNGMTNPRGYSRGDRLWDVTPLFPRQPLDLRTSVGIPGLTLRECASICALVGEDCTGFGVYDRRTKMQAINTDISGVLSRHFRNARGDGAIGAHTSPPGSNGFLFGTIFTASQGSNLTQGYGAVRSAKNRNVTDFEECHMFTGRPRDAVATARGGAMDESSWTEAEQRGHLTAPAGTIFVDRLWIPARVGAGPGWNGGWQVNETRTVVSALDNSEGLLVTNWGTVFAVGFEGNVSDDRSNSGKKMELPNRAGSLIRAAIKQAQLPLDDYFTIATSSSSSAFPRGCQFANTEDHSCNRGEQSNASLGGIYMIDLSEDGFRCNDMHGNPLDLNECSRQCADAVARNRHKCTSGMWMGEESSLSPNPAVGVDPGYPFQDWITFFVRTEPDAACVCIRTTGRLFGEEQLDLIQTQDRKLDIWPHSPIERDNLGQDVSEIVDNMGGFLESAIFGIRGLLSKTQTYGRRNDSGPLLVEHHGFGGMAPRIRAIKFLADSEAKRTGSSEQDILSAQMHWSAVGAALFSNSGSSISSRRHRCHPVFDDASWNKEHVYAEYPKTNCMQPSHREALSEMGDGYSLNDAKVNCNSDPTCRAVSCDRGNTVCHLSAAVWFNVAEDGENCHIKTASRGISKATSTRIGKVIETSAEDAFSTCNLVSDNGQVHIKITEESTLGKLRNGTCKWVPVHDIGLYSKQHANDRMLSCADAIRDIYDDACFATVYSELLSPSQRRAVCANMAGDGGHFASGCGFARPLCDVEEDNW